METELIQSNRPGSLSDLNNNLENPLPSTPENSQMNSVLATGLELLPRVLKTSNLLTPINDSRIILEKSLSVIETDEDDNGASNEKPVFTVRTEKRVENSNTNLKRYSKPARPCVFSQKMQSRLKSNILTKYKLKPPVPKILNMSSSEQDLEIDIFRKQAVKGNNLKILKNNGTKFKKKRRNLVQQQEMPIMCSGCKSFFAKGYKARH